VLDLRVERSKQNFIGFGVRGVYEYKSRILWLSFAALRVEMISWLTDL